MPLVPFRSFKEAFSKPTKLHVDTGKSEWPLTSWTLLRGWMEPRRVAGGSRTHFGPMIRDEKSVDERKEEKKSWLIVRRGHAS